MSAPSPLFPSPRSRVRLGNLPAKEREELVSLIVLEQTINALVRVNDRKRSIYKHLPTVKLSDTRELREDIARKILAESNGRETRGRIRRVARRKLAEVLFDGN